MLIVVVAFVLFLCLVSGAYFAQRAPAVAFALFGAVVWGFIGYAVSVVDNKRGVPVDVAVWASCALVVAGVVGLFAVRPRGPRRELARAAVAVLLAGPIAVAAVALLLLEACPLYVTERAGFCDYGNVDMLGGWVSEVVFLFGCDVMAVAVLLLLSARRAQDPPESLHDRPHDSMPGEPPHPASADRP
jgi:hypothetical protein